MPRRRLEDIYSQMYLYKIDINYSWHKKKEKKKDLMVVWKETLWSSEKRSYDCLERSYGCQKIDLKIQFSYECYDVASTY